MLAVGKQTAYLVTGLLSVEIFKLSEAMVSGIISPFDIKICICSRSELYALLVN